MAKIRLSEEELSLVADARVMLVKGAVMAKVSDMLGALSERQASMLTGYGDLIPEAVATTPKVSRGENYRGQPYLVLDYPRHFKQDDILALRTIFLWGHHLGVTLHLRGPHRERCRLRLSSALPFLAEAGLLVCVADTEWEHHFGEDNYLPARDMSESDWERLLAERGFTKIAYAHPVAAIHDAADALLAAYAALLSLLR